MAHRKQTPGWFLPLLGVFLLCFNSTFAGPPDSVAILDLRHFSKVLGEMRNFRVFLPPGYARSPEKKYPVIYFFHGWSQRYFGASDPYADYDHGDQNGGDNIANFVGKKDVIIVKVDGYNRSPDEKYYVRPWNVSPVETHRQFPLYFPELVQHVDANFRTIADREHRGISGLSMGGFMTFWIGGKYPHLLSAAGNFCGSPEFIVGPKDFPVEYRHLDMYDNYGGMNLRLHYGTKDFIRGYHEDLNKVWPHVIDNYSYRIYEAAHTTCGLGDMFSFILDTFESPPARPSRWHHTDVYPEFSVWDYTVSTDRTAPGFTLLENVDEGGFRCAVREHLPDGSLLSGVNVVVVTAPRYDREKDYVVNDIDLRTGKASQRTIRSDAEGRLTVRLNGSAHEVGITSSDGKPDLELTSFGVQGARWATHGKQVSLALTVANKGASAAKNVTVTLSSTRPGVQILQSRVTLQKIDVNEVRPARETVSFRVNADSMSVVRLAVDIRDGQGNEWTDFIDLPLKKNVPEITDFVIADGKEFTVAKAGTQTETLVLGKGNGDGIANPGESIVVLVRDAGQLWRTSLSSNDPLINPFGIRLRESDNWASLDHVGGSAKYDIILVSSAAPRDHALEFFAEYWLPDAPLHIIRQGKVAFRVRGKDTTPPAIAGVLIDGDNVVSVRLVDGAEIKTANIRLTSEKDPEKVVRATLTDNGTGGDRVERDLVFSGKIPDQYFGIFKLSIEVEDVHGNKTTYHPEDQFVLH